MVMPSIQQSVVENPDPLGRLTDQIFALIDGDLPADRKDELRRLLSDWTAELIGRCASQAAAAVLSVASRVERLEDAREKEAGA